MKLIIGLKIRSQFLKKIYKWPTNTHKICSTLLIIRGMQNITTIRYSLKPVRMAIIKKSKNGWVQWLMSVIPALWEVRWVDHEVRSSRPA